MAVVCFFLAWLFCFACLVVRLCTRLPVARSAEPVCGACLNTLKPDCLNTFERFEEQWQQCESIIPSCGVKGSSERFKATSVQTWYKYACYVLQPFKQMSEPTLVRSFVRLFVWMIFDIVVSIFQLFYWLLSCFVCLLARLLVCPSVRLFV